MILVTLGTQKQQFSRLLDYIEQSDIDDEIIVQAGHTKYKSKKMKIFDFIDYDKMNEYVEKADIIITHGGTGSIIGPLKKGKKVIACARKSKYLEHVDNHQEQIVDVFSDEGYILKLDEGTNLSKLVKKAKNLKVKKFESNTNSFIEKLKKEIETEKKTFRNYYFSILFIFFIIITPSIIILRPQRKISVVENRTLNQIYFPKIKEIMNGTYQDNLENGLADQMILAATLKKSNNRINEILLNTTNNIIYNDSDIFIMSKGYCKLARTDYLIRCPRTTKDLMVGGRTSYPNN